MKPVFHLTPAPQTVRSFIALAVAFLPFLAGCRRDTPAATAPVAVQVATVAEHAIPDEIAAAGAIDAVDKAEVGFLVAGRVISVDVEDGAFVKKGQVLARLDPADFQQTLAIAESRLSEVRSRHERLSKMHELGSLTATDYDKITSALREAESAAELARRQLAYTELRAPFDGRVVRRGIATGFVVIPAAPLFTVLAPAPVWANLSIAESDAHRVSVGQSARIFLPSAGSTSCDGPVEAVLPQADPLSRSFTVKVRLPNTDGALRPGNVITALIATGASHSAILVPPQAVQKHPDGSRFVWTVDPQRKTAVKRLVETGALRATDLEITSGLKAGEQIVVNVPLTLFEGTPLAITHASP